MAICCIVREVSAAVEDKADAWLKVIIHILRRVDHDCILGCEGVSLMLTMAACVLVCHRDIWAQYKDDLYVPLNSGVEDGVVLSITVDAEVTVRRTVEEPTREVEVRLMGATLSVASSQICLKA